MCVIKALLLAPRNLKGGYVKKKKKIRTQGGLWEALLDTLFNITLAVAAAKGKKR